MTINKEQAVSDAVFERLDELVGYLEAMNQDRITHGGRVVFTSDLDEILSVAKAVSHPLEQRVVSGDVVERVARALWLDSCDWLGWPNGQPTWDEMSAWPESDRNNRCEEFRSLAEAALTASGMGRMREALEPFAELAGGDINMNDPLRKWITVGQLWEARTALQGGE